MRFAESKQLKNSGHKVNSAGICLFIQLLRNPYVTCFSPHQISRRVSGSESSPGQMCHRACTCGDIFGICKHKKTNEERINISAPGPSHDLHFCLRKVETNSILSAAVTTECLATRTNFQDHQESRGTRNSTRRSFMHRKCS